MIWTPSDTALVPHQTAATSSRATLLVRLYEKSCGKAGKTHTPMSSASMVLRRGLDNRVYYMLAPQGQYYNYSGCGNTLNCNHPVVRQFIIACLRYWVTEVSVGHVETSQAAPWLSASKSESDAVDAANIVCERRLLAECCTCCHIADSSRKPACRM